MANIAVLDFETDPFEHGVVVKPFLAGFYDGKRKVTFWGPDCVDRLVSFLKAESTVWTIYAHNGGRFDFFFLLSHLDRGNMRIINGRIVQAHLERHELRDSFAIMPFPLADYKKDEIDYEKMRHTVREKHRDEILQYFGTDLESLYELVVAFHTEFGDKLTIGSASMRELRKRCPFKTGGQNYDEKFRTDYYFGGRNQVFRSGVITGDIKVYDINSSYSYSMSSMLHPLGIVFEVSKRIERDTFFVKVEGVNRGAFPTRTKSGGLDFTLASGIFSTTIHEFQAAIETGTFKPTRILKTYRWRDYGTFDEFVSHFYDARRKAKSSGDKIRTIFYKFILNSTYGKFAQNPDNYFDWFVTDYGGYPPDYHECGKGCDSDCQKRWSPAYVFDLQYIIWKRPLQRKLWYNVATGASITGASRSVLLRGICATREPLYVDTDSIICRGPSSVQISDNELGRWKLEATGRMVAIAGKKLYAVFGDKGEVIKKAHKGARLTGQQILSIAKGAEVTYNNPVPSFKWDGTAEFIIRRIKRTA